MKVRWNLDEMRKGIDQSDRIQLGRAITLIESKLADDQLLAKDLLDRLLPKTGKSIRIGITGIPGVGKSTFIEALGGYVINKGYKVAVLTIDPSSTTSKGSILGDKTRMTDLSKHPNVFIRPSPSSNSLGGVSQKTRETIFLCEAAGYDFIIVETVGVGQSETAVRDMVDFFLLLMLAGSGDELQGIKRGIMEMADLLVINKTDNEASSRVKLAQKAYENALHLFPPSASGWTVPVSTCSSLNKDGIEAIFNTIRDYEVKMIKSGYLKEERQRQNVHWFREMIQSKLMNDFFTDNDTITRIDTLSEQVANGQISARSAIEILFNS